MTVMSHKPAQVNEDGTTTTTTTTLDSEGTKTTDTFAALRGAAI